MNPDPLTVVDDDPLPDLRFVIDPPPARDPRRWLIRAGLALLALVLLLTTGRKR